jgi:hypothetical protein
VAAGAIPVHKSLAAPDCGRVLLVRRARHAGTLAIPEMITASHLSAGAGAGSSQKGILRVIGSGPRYADAIVDRARMPSRPLVCTGRVT